MTICSFSEQPDISGCGGSGYSRVSHPGLRAEESSWPIRLHFCNEPGESLIYGIWALVKILSVSYLTFFDLMVQPPPIHMY